MTHYTRAPPAYEPRAPAMGLFAERRSARPLAGRWRSRLVSRDPREDFVDDAAGQVIVPDRVAEFLELIEDDAVRPRAADLPALVIYLFYIRLAARRADDLCPDRLEPGEPLRRHLLRQDRNRIAAQERAVERAAAAVVPRTGPDRFLRTRIELSGYQPRHETAERGADFVRSGREPLSEDADDAGVRSGQLVRKFNPVAVVEAAAALDRFVLPRDAKQVERIDIRHGETAKPLGNSRGNGRRFRELSKHRNDDAALTAMRRRLLQHLFVDGVNPVQSSLCRSCTCVICLQSHHASSATGGGRYDLQHVCDPLAVYCRHDNHPTSDGDRVRR